MEEKRYKNLEDFYPFYLSEHQKRGARILHFVGTSFFFYFFILSFYTNQFLFLLVAITTPYLFAWIGHFWIEKNKPAAFKYPFLSLISDFRLYFEIIMGKEGWGK